MAPGVYPKPTDFAFRVQELPGGDGRDRMVLRVYPGGEHVPWLVVKDSSIPNIGKGLFAARDFGKGAWLGRYTGHVLSSRKTDPDERLPLLEWQAGRGHYLINVRGAFVDGARPPQPGPDQGVATGWHRALYSPNDIENWPAPFLHMINDPMDPSKVNTVVWSNGFAQTTRAVREGEELFWMYGEEYWANFRRYNRAGRRAIATAPRSRSRSTPSTKATKRARGSSSSSSGTRPSSRHRNAGKRRLTYLEESDDAAALEAIMAGRRPPRSTGSPEARATRSRSSGTTTRRRSREAGAPDDDGRAPRGGGSGREAGGPSQRSVIQIDSDSDSDSEPLMFWEQ